MIAASIAATAGAEGRWNVYGGGSISHVCETCPVGSDRSYGWGGGFFAGGGYEWSLTSHWSIMPQAEMAYVNNGGTLSSPELDFSARHSNWLQTWNLNVPVTVNYRFAATENVWIRSGAGPYLQESLSGRRYAPGTDRKENMSGSFSDRFNVGAIGEIAVETGRHMSYMVRVQYPFLKEGWVRKTLTLSAGVRYTF